MDDAGRYRVDNGQVITKVHPNVSDGTVRVIVVGQREQS